MTALVDFLEQARVAVWIARGPALAAALDASLQLQETAALPSLAWSAAEYSAHPGDVGGGPGGAARGHR